MENRSNADAIRNRLLRTDNSSASDNNNTGGRSGLSNSPDTIITELQSLRKKYDAVVEYTVHLTAERDSIVAQLENSQRELLKEKAKKKNDNNQSPNGNQLKSDKKNTDKVVLIYYAYITMFYSNK